MKGKRVRLGEVCFEYVERNRNSGCDSVCSVTNSAGFVASEEYFDKKVFSKDLAAYKVVRPGMFAYNPSRINVGSVACYEGPSPVVVSPLYIVFRVDEALAETRYLSHYIRSPLALHTIRSRTTGSVRDSLKFSALCQLEIPLPPLSAQRKIAEELDRICALKRGAEKVVEKLGVLAKAKFVEMFGDLAVNQHGYKIVSFDDAASIEGGLETDYEKYANYPHIGIDSIEKDTGLLVGYRTVAQDHVKSGKYHFTEKHIIYSKIRPNLNKVALPSFEGLCSADAYAVLPGKNTDRVFLAYVLRSKQFLDYIVPLSGRSGMPKANQGQVRGFRFPLPPLPLQRQFAAYVGKVEKIEAAAKKVVEKLDVLYRAKLQEYFA